MRGGLRPVGKLVHEEVEHIERVSKSSAPYTGIETGYYRLDELTSGLQKQDLIILAARPGVGKTALALNIAAHCAVRQQSQGGGLLARDVRRRPSSGGCWPRRRGSTCGA